MGREPPLVYTLRPLIKIKQNPILKLHEEREGGDWRREEGDEEEEEGEEEEDRVGSLKLIE